jgi:hypothetical protein
MMTEDNHLQSVVDTSSANLIGLIGAISLCLQAKLVLPTLESIHGENR